MMDGYDGPEMGIFDDYFGVDSGIDCDPIRPGAVVPDDVYDGEWTFYFFRGERRVMDQDENPCRTFTSAAGAKQAMRERCGIA